MSLPDKLQRMPWRKEPLYWVTVQPQASAGEAASLLRNEGFTEIDGKGWLKSVPHPWVPVWKGVSDRLREAAIPATAAVIPGEEQPDREHIALSLKSPEFTDQVAESLWLAEALERGDVICYLQPVVSITGATIGYESFVRVRDGERIVGGYEVVRAARALGIEYMIDRHLHVEAIKTYVAGKVQGYLFVNFFPGFIHRPEVYLEGLSETVRENGVIPKHIVLDFTRCESAHDIAQMRKVTDYCRSKGYAIALDDIESLSGAHRLISEIRPDFIKLDKKLVQCSKRAEDIENIRQIVKVSHAAGVMVIAEGVEKSEMLDMMKSAAVDLFQGYYFAAPMPVEEALQREARPA